MKVLGGYNKPSNTPMKKAALVILVISICFLLPGMGNLDGPSSGYSQAEYDEDESLAYYYRESRRFAAAQIVAVISCAWLLWLNRKGIANLIQYGTWIGTGE